VICAVILPGPGSHQAGTGKSLADADPVCRQMFEQADDALREAGVRRLASEGVTTYVEVGPGTVLSGLVRKIKREPSVRSFGSPDDLAAVEALFHV
jgi:[acyl-carrier-protein] S-malonyltransferase